MFLRCAHPLSNSIVIFSAEYCSHSPTLLQRAAKLHRQQRNRYANPLTLPKPFASPPEECFYSYRECNQSEQCAHVWLLFPMLADQSSGNGHCQGRAAMLRWWVRGHGSLPADICALHFREALTRGIYWSFAQTYPHFNALLWQSWCDFQGIVEQHVMTSDFPKTVLDGDREMLF